MTELGSSLSPKAKKTTAAVTAVVFFLLIAAWWITAAIFAVSVGVWGFVAWVPAVLGILRQLGKSAESYVKAVKPKDTAKPIVVNVSNNLTDEQIRDAVQDAAYWKLANNS